MTAAYDYSQTLISDQLRQPDAQWVCDMTGNGKMDIVLGWEPSDGTSKVAWFEQGVDPYRADNWTQHDVDASAGTQIQGLVAYDFDSDGVPEIYSLDQADGIIRAHVVDDATDPQGSWTTTQIVTSRPGLQSAEILTVDGSPAIVYAWEGSASGEGGINWLSFGSGDAGDSSNWTDNVAYQIEGAWWIAYSGFADLSGDGNTDDLLFTTRTSTAHNSAAAGGVRYLSVASTPTNTWSLTNINTTDSDWLHCDWGDFFGNGNTDATAVVRTSSGPRIFDQGSAWAETDLGDFFLGAMWNVRKVDRLADSARDELVVSDGQAGLYHLWHDGSNWLYGLLHAQSYGHNNEDRIDLVDFNGDQFRDLIVDDAGPSTGSSTEYSLYILRIHPMALASTHRRRHAIDIDRTKIDGDLTDHPVTLTRANFDHEILSPSDANAAQSDGLDIRFSSDKDGANPIPFDLITWSQDSSDGAGDGSVEITLNVPSLRTDRINRVYVWYGLVNTGRGIHDEHDYGRYAAYPSEVAMFFPLETSIDNRTGLSVAETVSGTVADVAGKIGRARDFQGGEVSLDSRAVDAESFSVLAWVDGDADAVDENVFVNGNGTGSGFKFRKQDGNGGALEVGFPEGANVSSSLTFGSGWEFVGLTYDNQNGTANFYLDDQSEEVTGGATMSTTPDDSATIGNDPSNDNKFDGKIDHLMILTGVVSQAFRETLRNNTSDPAAFASPQAPEIVNGVRVGGGIFGGGIFGAA